MNGFPDRVRLLIDGDNTSHDLLPSLMRLLGEEVEGRVLCNPCSHSGWAGALKRTPSRILLVRVPSRDKNAVDDRLMELMCEGRPRRPSSWSPGIRISRHVWTIWRGPGRL